MSTCSVGHVVSQVPLKRCAGAYVIGILVVIASLVGPLRVAAAQLPVLQWGSAGQGSSIASLSVIPDGYLAAAGHSGDVKVWQLSTGSLFTFVDSDLLGVQDAALALANNRIAAVNVDGILRTWSVPTGGQVLSVKVTSAGLSSVAVSPDGTKTASGSDDGRVFVVTPSGQVSANWTAHTGRVTALSYSSDGLYLATAGEDNLAKTWQVGPNTLVRTFTGHSDDVTSIGYAPGNARLVTGSVDKTARVWNTTTGAVVFNLTGHTSDVTTVAYTPDGAKICSGSNDSSVRVWNAVDGSLVTSFGATPPVPISACVITPDSQQVIVARERGDIEYWQIATGTFVKRHDGHFGAVTDLTFKPDGNALVSSSVDGTAVVRQTVTGAIVTAAVNPAMSDPPPFVAPAGAVMGANPITAVAVRPNGLHLVTAGLDGEIRLHDASNGSLIRTYTGHTDSAFAVGVTPDGNTVIGGANDNTVRTWKLNSGAAVHTLTGHTDTVRCVRGAIDLGFDGGGGGGSSTTSAPPAQPQPLSMVLSGSDDGTVRAWRGGSQLWSYEVAGEHVACLAVSPDSSRVAAGYSDSKIRILDVATGTLIREIPGHQKPVVSIAYSTAGDRLFSASNDRTVRAWDPLTGVNMFIDNRSLAADVVTLAYGTGSQGARIAYGHRDGTVMVLSLP